QETIGRNLWRTDHALAQILDEQVRILTVALASVIADDRLGGCRHSNERVLIALVADLVALNALLFFADVAPNFVQFQTAGANANHHPVMQLGATAPDTLAK